MSVNVIVSQIIALTLSVKYDCLGYASFTCYIIMFAITKNTTHRFYHSKIKKN